MAKKPSPLDIMNTFGKAAHTKSQTPKETDADEAPEKSSKQSSDKLKKLPPKKK